MPTTVSAQHLGEPSKVVQLQPRMRLPSAALCRWRAYSERMPVPGTKLRLPSSRRRLVERARLVDPLRAEEAPRLVLVAAPAGFGKTTLLVQWLASQRRVAWLALDSGDAEP